jgi:protein TonB
MSWNRIARVAAALVVTAAVAAPSISASVAKQVDQQKIRVGGDDKEPKKIKDVKPEYPADAQAAGIQGVVILETIIGPSGAVSDARVLRSIPALDQAAVDAVRQWEFTPTLLNGVPVPVIMTVTVNFTLR